MARSFDALLRRRSNSWLSSPGILLAICFALVALPGWSLGQQRKPDREEQAAAKPQAPEGYGLLPPECREALSIELPAACLKGVPKNMPITSEACMRCHTRGGIVAGVSGSESASPVLSEIPFISRLFKNACMKCHATWQLGDDDYGTKSDSKPDAVTLQERVKKLEFENQRLRELLAAAPANVPRMLWAASGAAPTMAEEFRKAALEEKARAEKEHRRLLELFAEMAITQQQLDGARVRVERADANLRFAGFVPRQAPKSPKEPPEERVKTFMLQHAKATEVSRILKELFPGNEERTLRITADARTNSVLVRGRVKELEAVQQIITRLDRHRERE